MSNVELFKNSFVSLAKPTRFEVSGFNLPATTRTLIKSAQIPGETMGVIEVPYQGRKIKHPGDRTYQPWTITVINPIDFNLHQEFRNWMNEINATVANVGLPPVATKRDGIITQLDDAGVAVKDFRFVGAFPSEIGPIEVGWENNDSYEEFTVTLEFDYFL